MSKIIPTILTDSTSIYQEKFEMLKTITDRIQVDFMDGDFVETKSVKPDEIELNQDFGSKLTLEAHLMVEEPMKWLNKLNSDFNFAYIHFETKKLKDEWTNWQEQALLKGIRLGLAINPDTPISVIKSLSPAPEALLIMGVNPGRSGQAMLEGTIEKIKNAKEIFFGPIGIDGGVRKENLERLVASGADYIYVGSSLSESTNLVEEWKSLNKIINQGEI